jgi:hypothetical protein
VTDPFDPRDQPALTGTVMPPSGGRDGEYLEAKGPGTLQDAHAPEMHALELLGKDPESSELTPEWVIKRLMRESTDYGTRSRQTARVAALGLLGKALGMFEGVPPEDPQDTPLGRALAMPPEERKQKLLRGLVDTGMMKLEDAKAAGLKS